MLESIFIARQPIFNDKEKILGYEVLFRSCKGLNKAGVIDDEQATSRVIIDGLNLVYQAEKSYKYFINFSEKLLLDKVFELLPKENTVIEILENVTPGPKILEVCNQIKANGYLLAIDDYVGQIEFFPLIKIADIVKVDILALSPTKVKDIVIDLKKQSKILLAEKVETEEQLKFCLNLGFNYFQGFFFSKPEILEGHKLSSSQLSKLDILKELSHSKISFRRLEEIIRKDVAITYRLLKYINSPYFGLRQKVESISRALAYLGEDKLKKWLRVAILADFSADDKKREVVFFSAFRGRFLQLLAKELELGKDKEEKFFLLGLLSYLDVLLGRSLKAILEELPLEDDIVDGLLLLTHPYHIWLDLAEAVERGYWVKIRKVLKILKIEPSLSASVANQAYEWAKSLMCCLES
ncbi:EAL and HDOD domain-containing protein [Desulfonauticus submarinus]